MLSDGYVLYGGGDFAIEVATYLLDVASLHGLDQRPPKLLPGSIISDVVSNGTHRGEDFAAILGSQPNFHGDMGTVQNIDKKQIVICVGSADVRHQLLSEVKERGGQLGKVIHPSAYISKTAKIGDGSIVCPFAFVGPFATIGSNCAINVSAVVGHDAILGTSTVLSPGARVNGWAETGDASFLGAGALLSPKTRLGKYSKLSSGSVLTKPAGDGFLMHGNPATGRQMMKLP